jgi:hypothetical protein
MQAEAISNSDAILKALNQPAIDKFILPYNFITPYPDFAITTIRQPLKFKK